MTCVRAIVCISMLVGFWLGIAFVMVWPGRQGLLMEAAIVTACVAAIVFLMGC